MSTDNTNTFTINPMIDNNDSIETPDKKQKIDDVSEENSEENSKENCDKFVDCKIYEDYNIEKIDYIDYMNEIKDINYIKDDYIIKNLCVECGVDMGYCNPRQYCGKTYCTTFR
jgi:hypothetical protein